MGCWCGYLSGARCRLVQYIAQLMAMPLTTTCFSKIQIGFTFLVPAHPGSPEKGPLNGYSHILKYLLRSGRPSRPASVTSRHHASRRLRSAARRAQTARSATSLTLHELTSSSVKPGTQPVNSTTKVSPSELQQATFSDERCARGDAAEHRARQRPRDVSE